MSDQLLPRNGMLEAAAQIVTIQQATIAQLQDDITRLRSNLQASKRTIAELEAEIRDLTVAVVLHQPRQVATEPAVNRREIAQALRNVGVPLRTIGAALGVSEKTIRNWTAEVLHIKEAA